jgi:hypothetical protein
VKTPGSQPGSCGFNSRRRYQRLVVGEKATPPASGAGDRWFDSSRPDLRGRGAAVPASLMSSRPWVRIPPALSILKERSPTGGRGSDGTTAMQSMGRNVQLASTSLQGRPVRRWRRGHAQAGVPMGNSWLRDCAAEATLCPGCGKQAPPSDPFLEDVAQSARASACRAEGRGFESRRPRRGDRGVAVALRVVSPAAPVRNRSVTPPSGRRSMSGRRSLTLTSRSQQRPTIGRDATWRCR